MAHEAETSAECQSNHTSPNAVITIAVLAPMVLKKGTISAGDTAGVSAVLAHRCEEKDCSTCYVREALEQGVYKKRMPLDPTKTYKGSWVKVCFTNGSVALGCTVCQSGKFSRCEISNSFGVVTGNLLKHQETFSHRKAVARALGRPDVHHPSMAPGVDVFRKALAEKLKGTATKHGVEGVGARHKMAKLLFCLKEARLKQERAFIRKATSVAIHQDVAGKRLLIKYCAATPGLDYKSGVIGACHVLEHGRGALGVARATKHIIQRFCTPFNGINLADVPPVKQNRVKLAECLDEELEKHMRHHIEMYDTDGAADEMLAGRLLKNGVSAGLQHYFPRVLVFKRDSTHAVKRSGGFCK